jgi:hypothetical protein
LSYKLESPEVVKSRACLDGAITEGNEKIPEHWCAVSNAANKSSEVVFAMVRKQQRQKLSTVPLELGRCLNSRRIEVIFIANPSVQWQTEMGKGGRRRSIIESETSWF